MSFKNTSNLCALGATGAITGYSVSQYFDLRAAGITGPKGGFGTSAGIACGIAGALTGIALVTLIETIAEDVMELL
jgi:hypothetical protein